MLAMKLKRCKTLEAKLHLFEHHGKFTSCKNNNDAYGSNQFHLIRKSLEKPMAYKLKKRWTEVNNSDRSSNTSQDSREEMPAALKMKRHLVHDAKVG
jgi:hypothetical protein